MQRRTLMTTGLLLTLLAACCPLPALSAAEGPALSAAEPAAFSFHIWSGGEDDVRQQLVVITNGASIDEAILPRAGINIWMDIKGTYDGVGFHCNSTDGYIGGWDAPLLKEGITNGGLYHLHPRTWSFFPHVGTYELIGTALLDGKQVGKKVIKFTITYDTKPPHDTTYMKTRTDSKGTPITTSKPVILGHLNETPKLKDNDYPYAPQKAFDTVNWERFPPFKMNPKFLTIWGSMRWQDEPKYGGPLNRGFSMVAHETEFENLRINQRACFDYPGSLEGNFTEMAKKNPDKYGDMLSWILPYRSPWMSHSNAYDAGWNLYNGISRGGERECGIFGWDEEEMWWSRGEQIFKERPEWLPADLKAIKEKDPDMKDPATKSAIELSYRLAWADFLGWGYKGAVDCAAARGRTIRIYHYGSLPIGLNSCWGTSTDPSAESPAPNETVDSLYEWYRNGNTVSFTNNIYTRTVQFYHKDSYFFYHGPQTLSMYEKDSKGDYVLDANGRRTVRTDVADDDIYAVPTKVGYEDYVGGPANMKEFIAKQENTLYWFNGGKYYKTYGTLTSDRRPMPTMRPGNQETMGKAAELGSRPNPPYLVEAAVINNFMLGNEGFYVWDDNTATGPLAGQAPNPDHPKFFGDLEYMIKGLHRLSQFNKLFDGKYSFIRPMREHDIWNRDQPVIRGIVNGRYLLLTMSNPFLDIGETQQVEVWYDAPYAKRKQAKWHDQVTIQHRKNHLFQCKLPALTKGYDPDKLYFHYTCVDGNYKKTFTVTGNYNVPYPYDDAK